MFTNFQSSYYKRESRPGINYLTFMESYPMVVFDCSRHPEEDDLTQVTLEWETHQPVPEDTLGYCLLLYDKAVTYHPMSRLIKSL